MWLLSTKTAVLRYFNRPEDVPGGYAILSHVWGKPEDEDTFQSVRAAAKTCEENASTRNFSPAGSSLPPTGSLADVVAELRETVQRQEEMLLALSEKMRKFESRRWPNTPMQESSDQPAADLAQAVARAPSSEDVAHTSADKFPITPRHSDLISLKIRKFLAQAEQDGYEWAWSDTCCIDKTSSTELTEAINSMFHYYSLSDICYAYLSDIPADALAVGVPPIWRTNPHFIESKWHKRGWTLQELLAPHNVVFMSQDWTPLGNKYTLADILEKATGIPASVLRMEQDIATMSVATRMSWASWRKTTRVEDEAYCLLGIFGINMPTIYGEGRNAFYRLQEEIIRSSIDSTFLVWGPQSWGNTIELRKELDELARARSGSQGDALAPSPGEFRSSGYVQTGYVATEKQVSTLSRRLRSHLIIQP